MRVFRRPIYHSILLADHAFVGLVVRPITVRHHQEVGEAMRLLQGPLRVLDMVLRRDLGGKPSFVALTELFHVDAVSLRLRIAAGPPSGYPGQNYQQDQGYGNQGGYYQSPPPQPGTLWGKPRMGQLLTRITVVAQLDLATCLRRKRNITGPREASSSLISSIRNATAARKPSVYGCIGT